MYGIKQESVRPEFALDWTNDVNHHAIPYLSYYDYYHACHNPYFNGMASVDCESLASKSWKRKREPESLFDVIESLELHPFKRLKLEYSGEEEIAEQNNVKSTIQNIINSNEIIPYTHPSYEYIVESPSCGESFESPRSEDSTEANSTTDLVNEQREEFPTPNPVIWKSLKDALTQYKIFQKQLAHDLKVSASTVSAYLTRKGRLNGWSAFEVKVEQWLSMAKKELKLNFINCSRDI